MRGYATLAGLLLGLASVTAQAQTIVPGDPHAGDPVGIVSDPCVTHPAPDAKVSYQMFNLHMLTRDFGQLCRYAADNRALAAQKVRVVFMGDSITDNWIHADANLFSNGVVDRGISGQTTPQMLVRFRADVIALKPQAVHIMAGTNDIAGNTGPMSPDQTKANIRTMTELARAHGIRVILASIPPADGFPWRPGLATADPIIAMNAWLKAYAAANNATYADYWTALHDGKAMRAELASDGVHPNAKGYAVMAPVADKAIRASLATPAPKAIAR